MTTLYELTIIHAPIARCFDLSRSIDVHLLGNVHFGEQAIALEPGSAGLISGLMARGDTVTWQARHFGIRQRLTSRITEFNAPHAFQDTMLSGAFAWMQHDHFFRQLPSGFTLMRDAFRYAAPIPILGRIAERLVLDRYMRNLLRERNSIIQQVAESNQWQQYV